MTTAKDKYLAVYNQFGLPIVQGWNRLSQSIFNHYHDQMVADLPTVDVPEDVPVDYTAKLAEMDNSIVQLKTQNQTLTDIINTQNQQIAADQGSIDTLRKQVTDQADSIKQYQDQITSDGQQISDLKSQLSSAVTNLESVRASNSALTSQNLVLQGHATDLQKQLDDANAKLATSEQTAKMAAFTQAFDMCVKLAAKGQVDNALAAATVIRSVLMADVQDAQTTTGG